jgi:ATP-dependent DNA helicase RecQ
VRPELDLPVRGLPARRRGKPPSTSREEPDPSAADPDFFARLKAWRTEEARRRGLPPYVVFHDRTLAAIAAARPAEPAELARIKGVGPAKLAAYGETVLRLIG